MTAHRLRARLRFRAGNGMATWALDQNTVRLGQAYHLNPGTLAEERSQQAAAGDIYTCDLIFPTEALAQDTWNTLIAVCVDGYLQPATDRREASWMDMHLCEHEGTPSPCPPPTQQWTNQAPPTATWVQPTGAHDAYPLNALVTHKGQTWKSTVAANVWEPGVYGWVVV